MHTTEDIAGETCAWFGLPSALAEVALRVDWDHADLRQDGPALLDAVRALTRSRCALDLRLARLCGWIHAGDATELGLPHYTAFVEKHVDFGHSWLRALVRLVTSDLDLVKRAAAHGLIPFSRAVEAPGRVSVEEQEAWLARAMAQRFPTEDWAGLPEDTLVDVSGEAARVVAAGRRLGELLLGWRAPGRVVDESILKWWQEDRSSEQLLADAREPPAPPAHPGPSWPDLATDPADAIVGPWVEPQDMAHALRLVEEVQAARKGRVVALAICARGGLRPPSRSPPAAIAAEAIGYHALYLHLGHDSLQSFCEVDLEVSVRTMQRYRRLGRTFGWYPELVREVREGLSLDKVETLVPALCQVSAADWMRIARSLDGTELRAAVERARVTHVTAVQRRYLRAIDRAPAVACAALASSAHAEATHTGALLDGRRLTVALAESWTDPRPDSGSRTGLRVHRDLPVACKWLLDSVVVPEPKGYARLKLDTDFTCTNPECRRRTLRCHVHHAVARAAGGGDEAENLRPVCPSCHLRLVHAGRLEVVRTHDAWVWIGSDRVAVVFDAP